MEMNQKTAEFDAASWAKRHPVLDTMGKAGLTGAGVAAISAMIADFIEARRQAKKQRERDKMNNDEDAIVFHVRDRGTDSEKAAEDCVGSCESHPCEDTNVTVVSEETGKSIKYRDGADQMRETNGRFSGFGKDAQWAEVPVDVMKIMGTLAAFPAGYMLVSKLHEKLERNRLKKQISAAQQEYIDLLDGKREEKTAEFCDMFLMDDPYLGTGTVKSAEKDPSKYNMLDRIASGMGETIDYVNRGAQTVSTATIAAALLTSGVSAWVVHKLLADRFDKKDNVAAPRKDMKIMFKSGSSEMEISPEQFMATVAVMRDCIRDSEPLSSLGAVKLAQAAEPVQQAAPATTPPAPAEPAPTPAPAAPAAPAPAAPAKPSRFRLPKLPTAESIREAANQATAAMNNGPAQEKTFNEWMNTPEGREYIYDAYISDPDNGYGVKRDASFDALRDDPRFRDYFTYLGIQNLGPSGARRAVKSMVMNNMQNNPVEWLSLLGSDKYKDFRDAAINKYISDAQGQGGFVGTLMGVPILGDVIKNLMRWYASGTQSGRNMMLRRQLATSGITDRERQNDILKNFDTSTGFRRVMPKQAGVVSNLKSNIDLFANMKVLSDMTNNELGSNMNKKDDKETSDKEPEVEVGFDKALMENLTEEQGKKLYQIAARIAAKRK